jgi:hypothetical protein
MTGRRIAEILCSVNNTSSSLGVDGLASYPREVDMTAKETNGSGPEHGRLVHAAMDAYVRWRDECEAVWDAHRRWSAAGANDAARAFMTYGAALDREEHASQLYAGLFRRLGAISVPDRELGEDRPSLVTGSPIRSIGS